MIKMKVLTKVSRMNIGFKLVQIHSMFKLLKGVIFVNKKGTYRFLFTHFIFFVLMLKMSVTGKYHGNSIRIAIIDR